MLTSKIETLLSYELDATSHFVLQIAAIQGPGQQVRDEILTVETGDGSAVPWRAFVDLNGNRLTRFDAGVGTVRLAYRATVERDASVPDDATLREFDITELPDGTLVDLIPTRFCESDLLAAAAQEYFGALPRGIGRVRAIIDWVQKNVEYRVGSTGPTTSAAEVHDKRVGVCRDFAHLCIAFCRALNIPARFVVGYQIFDEPPQDFHAIFEAWLGRWVAFDPTGLADPGCLVRVGVGRDAKDVAFATMFGPVRMTAMQIRMTEQLDGGELRVSDDSMAVMGPAQVRDDADSFSVRTVDSEPQRTTVEAVS